MVKFPGCRARASTRYPGIATAAGLTARADDHSLLSRRRLFTYPAAMIIFFAYEMTMITSGMPQMWRMLLSKDEKSGRRVSEGAGRG
jgi:hypothetical protein